MAINLDTAKREISEMVEMEEWLLLEMFAYELVDEVKRLRKELGDARAVRPARNLIDRAGPV
jgi:hypothetical protein